MGEKKHSNSIVLFVALMEARPTSNGGLIPGTLPARAMPYFYPLPYLGGGVVQTTSIHYSLWKKMVF